MSARSIATKFILVHKQMTKRANEIVNTKLKIMAPAILVRRNNIIKRKFRRSFQFGLSLYLHGFVFNIETFHFNSQFPQFVSLFLSIFVEISVEFRA